MQQSNSKTVEISIPSELGNEKIVMSILASFAKSMGFPQVRIDDLKTVISEAVTNAIEHGNQMHQECPVYITVWSEQGRLLCSVADQGKKPFARLPKKRKEQVDHRGWGMFLIQNLVDEVNLITQPGRNELRITMNLAH